MNQLFKKLASLILLIVLLASCAEQVKLEPLSYDATIVAFGDSLTFGTGSTKGNDYPSVLSKLLGMKVINAGIPGNTTADGLERINKVLEKHSPSLVILCLGGNDFLRKRPVEQTRENLNALIEIIKQKQSQVVLISVPKPAIFLDDAELYETIAQQHNIPLLNDTLSELLSDNELKSDAIHLNDSGYSQLAAAIQNFLIERGAL